ncbi:25042_t:CDS:2, partial [Dentiscutata erythropus]
ATKDVNEGLVGANLIPEETADNVDEVKKAIIQNVKWQMSFDRKIRALKSFQGYIWKSGFNSGELETEVYDDAVEAMNKWKDLGIKMFIYSSGSVSAQKLLFGHSDKGDLLNYFSGYFDTTIGSKLEKDSYLNIAKHIGVEPKDILFLSDNVKEISAAKNAGFQTAIVERPNNAPLSDDDRKDNIVLTNFLQIFSHHSYIEPLAKVLCDCDTTRKPSRSENEHVYGRVFDPKKTHSNQKLHLKQCDRLYAYCSDTLLEPPPPALLHLLTGSDINTSNVLY